MKKVLDKNIDMLIDEIEASLLQEGTLESIIQECLSDEVPFYDVELVDIEENRLDITLKNYTLKIIRKCELFLKSFKEQNNERH